MPTYNAQQAREILEGAQRFLKPGGEAKTGTAIDTPQEIDKFISTVFPSPTTTVSTIGSDKVVKKKINAPINTFDQASELAQANQQAQKDKIAEFDEDIQDLEAKRDAAFQQKMNAYSNLTVALTEQTNAMVASLQNQWNQAREAQKEINAFREGAFKQNEIRSGSGRYTPELSSGFIASVVEKGQQRLTSIDNGYTTAINNAKAALASKNFELALDAANEAEAFHQNAIEELKAQKQQAQEIALTLSEEQTKAAVSDAVFNAIQDGATDIQSVYESIRNSAGVDASVEDVESALKTFLPPQKDPKELTGDAAMLKMAKDEGWLPQDASIFDFWKAQADARRAPRQATGNATLSGEGSIREFQFVIANLPTRMKDSDEDVKRLMQYYEEARSAGLTAFDMVDELTGYRVEEKTAFTEGLRKYIATADLDTNTRAEVGRLVSQGDNEKAISVIENTQYAKMRNEYGERYVSESDVQYVNSKVKRINALLGEGWTNDVGVFEGTFELWLNQKFGVGEEGVAIRAALNSLTADMINRRAGSAMTDIEWKRLIAPNVPGMTESASTWATKLDELDQDVMLRLNSQRAQYQLPAIENEAQLYDRAERVPLYSEVGYGDPLQVSDTPSQRKDPLDLNIF